MASRFVIGLVEFSSLSVIRHASDSVGSEKLHQTYREALNHDKSIGNELIDLSIKFDNNRVFPKSETVGLARRLRKKPLARAILRRLVWLHFYLYEQPLALKQSVCAMLDIKVDGLLLLEAPAKKHK